ncbi:hypothetical protein MTO96_024595 [Rhipicephalus appendiculatus]
MKALRRHDGHTGYAAAPSAAHCRKLLSSSRPAKFLSSGTDRDVRALDGRVGAVCEELHLKQNAQGIAVDALILAVVEKRLAELNAQVVCAATVERVEAIVEVSAARAVQPHREESACTHSCAPASHGRAPHRWMHSPLSDPTEA